jgi:hypothetical protein
MLNQVADGVWVRQSAWVWSNAVVVRGESGLVLVDPGIDGAELDQLADDVEALGIPVVAGFSTHPHWDHLLWHPRFGDVPRYATAAGAHRASEARERAQTMAAQSASGIPLELIGVTTPLPADGVPVPGEIVEHQAHAIGHAAVVLADRGVLLAGDMLSESCSPSSTRTVPISWPPTSPHSTGWARPPGTSMSWSPGTGPLPRGPRWRAASRPILRTSTPCGAEKIRSTRGWISPGSRARTSRTWSRPDSHLVEPRAPYLGEERSTRRTAPSVDRQEDADGEDDTDEHDPGPAAPEDRTDAPVEGVRGDVIVRVGRHPGVRPRREVPEPCVARIVEVAHPYAPCGNRIPGM